MIEILDVEEISHEEFEEYAGDYHGFLIGICITVRQEDGEKHYLYVANPAFVPRPGETYVSYEQLYYLLKK